MNGNKVVAEKTPNLKRELKPSGKIKDSYSYEAVIKHVQSFKDKRNRKTYKKDILSRFEGIYFKIKHKVENPFKKFSSEKCLKFQWAKMPS